MNQSAQQWQHLQTIKLKDHSESITFCPDQNFMVVRSSNYMSKLKLNKNGKWDMEDQTLPYTKIQSIKSMVSSKINHELVNNNVVFTGCWAQLNKDWLNNYSFLSSLYCDTLFAFNHDMTLLAVQYDQNIVQVYVHNGTHIQTNQGNDNQWILTQTLSRHNKTIQCIKFNHNSSILATSDTECIILWKQVMRNQWIIEQVLLHPMLISNKISFNSQSTMLVAQLDKIAIIWIKVVNNKWKYLRVHQMSLRILSPTQVIFNRQSDLIISSSLINRIWIWKCASKGSEEQHLQCGQLIKVLINDKSNLLVILQWDRRIIFYTLQPINNQITV